MWVLLSESEACDELRVVLTMDSRLEALSNMWYECGPRAGQSAGRTNMDNICM